MSAYRVTAISGYLNPPQRIRLFNKKTLTEAQTRIDWYSRNGYDYSQFQIQHPSGVVEDYDPSLIGVPHN